MNSLFYSCYYILSVSLGSIPVLMKGNKEIDGTKLIYLDLECFYASISLNMGT